MITDLEEKMPLVDFIRPIVMAKGSIYVIVRNWRGFSDIKCTIYFKKDKHIEIGKLWLLEEDIKHGKPYFMAEYPIEVYVLIFLTEIKRLIEEGTYELVSKEKNIN